MRAKDKTEEVLKSMHVLFSRAELIEGSKRKVIVDRERILNLLKDLNDCIYAMMDEYEISEQAKEKALRENQKKADEQIYDARKNAEDIYAASIMYTDHTIDSLKAIMEQTEDELDRVHEEMKLQFEERQRSLRENQLELKNQLEALIDTQKYLRLIENENLRLARLAEKQAEDPDWGEEEVKKVEPEIRINEEYFRAQGLLPVEDEGRQEVDISLSANLDDDFFEWRNEKQEDKEEDFIPDANDIVNPDEDEDEDFDDRSKSRLFGIGRTE